MLDQCNEIKVDIKLVSKLNDRFQQFHIARVFIEDAPEYLIDCIQRNSEKIEAQICVIRNDQDEAAAASFRNSGKNVLFVFPEEIWVKSYFSSCSERLGFSKQLLNKIKKTTS